MPRVFAPDDDRDYTDEELDNGEPYRVGPEAFEYLAPPDFCGPPEPVYVQVAPGAPLPVAPKPGLFDRLIGRTQPASPTETDKKETEAAAEIAARMAALGAVSAYCRYDGGSDEGFAWFDHCVFADGSMRDAKRMAEDLKNTGVQAWLTGLWNHRFDMQTALDDLLASYWAVKLLGSNYGVGELLIYGAFSVDLRTGLVTDDRNPDPIVKNFEFGG